MSKLKQFSLRFIPLLAILLARLPASGQGSPNIIWTGHANGDRINTVTFDSSGQTLISGSSDRLIQFWRVSDGALIRTLNSGAPSVHESAIEWVSITRDGSRLASASYRVIRLWTLPQGTSKDLSGHTDWVVCVAFSPNGQLLASASFDTTVKIWRASDGALLRTLPNALQMRCVAFSPDSSLLATAGSGGTIHLFRTSDWVNTQNLTGHEADVYTMTFSPDGTKLASGGYDKTARVWNVADGSLNYTLGGNNGNVYGIAFTPDGTQLAYTDGEGDTIRIHRVSDGARLRLFTQEVNEVQALAFSSSGLLAYGRVDQRVILCSINGGTPPQSWTLSTSVSGDGSIQVSPGPNGPGGTYMNGTVVTLTANPQGENHFLGWSGSISRSEQTVSLIMNGNKQVTATFTSGNQPQTEIVWQYQSGLLARWLLSGSHLLGAGLISNAGSWRLVTVDDFNGDGQKDFLFQNTGGTLAAWLMNGDTVVSASLLRNGVSAGPSWKAVAAGDFNGDGDTDILFQNTTGQLAVWFMNQIDLSGAAFLNHGSSAGGTWRVVGVGDFNNDGNADILWQNNTKTVAIWFMDRTNLASTSVVRSNGETGWQAAVGGDLNDDGQKDILWQHADGRLEVWYLNNGNFTSASPLVNGQRIAPGWHVAGVR